MPVYAAADGLTASHRADKSTLRFGPRAAKLYRGLAGQKATVGCGDPSVKDDGSSRSTGGTGRVTLDGRAGYWWSERGLPRKRGTVAIPVGSAADVCFIATAARKSDDLCVPFAPGEVGLYQSGQTTVAAALLADGRRRFVRQDGEIFSTNVPALSRTYPVASLI